MLNPFPVLAALLAALGLAAPPTPSARVLCTLRDPRISESSGVAVTGDVLWTHNDSGDTARFFALDRRCRTLATYTLRGVRATDWEDMAQAAGGLWFADIGDNRASRDEVQVHRVAVPATSPRKQVLTPTTYRFRYADGPHDAEALLVDPRGRVYVVTKAYLGDALVFASPAQPSTAGVNVLRQVASFSPTTTGTPGGPIGALGQLTVTGGALDAAGDRLVLRTYTDAYEWTMTGGDVERAFSTAPVVTPLPETPQGEGIAYDGDGRGWVTTSEGAGSPVHLLTRGR